MRTYKAETKDNNRRIDDFLFDALKGSPASTVYKAFRKRNIKVNGVRVKESCVLQAGDTIEVYIPEEYLSSPSNKEQSARDIPVISYEDDYLIIVSKPQGMPVHQDRNEEAFVLDEWVQNYLRERDNLPYQPGFPALCHRIDRNTGGLVILAKDPATLKVMEDRFYSHDVHKKYLCLVNGVPEKQKADLKAYLKKNSTKSQVYIYDNHVRGSEPIITRYRTLKAMERFALLEVELITGKTHQIRAHLAYIGHPIIGDGKYGENEVNRSLGIKWQALWAYRLTFDPSASWAHLDYMKGKTVSLKEILWEKPLETLGLKDLLDNIIE